MSECDYEKVERLIGEGNLKEAQDLLDASVIRPARWHYDQSRLFTAKGWLNESRKQLEIAATLEPDNSDYLDELEKVRSAAEQPAGQVSATASTDEEKRKKKCFGKQGAEDAAGCCCELGVTCVCEWACSLLCEACGS